MVGHKVTKCQSATDCAAAVANGHFDVVLADPSDAAKLKATSAQGILPVLMKPSKEDMNRAKTDYSVAFDASRDAVRLLPMLVKIAKREH
jgi:hypothetical protein